MTMVVKTMSANQAPNAVRKNIMAMTMSIMVGPMLNSTVLKENKGNIYQTEVIHSDITTLLKGETIIRMEVCCHKEVLPPSEILLT